MSERKLTITGNELMAMEFEDVPMLAENLLIRHGFCILASSPKIGKSWLCLDLHAKATTGGSFLGKFPLGGMRSLYFPLEDRERRMKKRLTAMNYVPTDNAIFHFGWTANNQKPEDFLREMVAKHSPDIIIIDDIRSATPGRIDEKEKHFGDYWRPVQNLALELEILIIGVYHLRKELHEDPILMISGSNSFVGVADEAMVLQRNRGSQDALLSVVSRDFEEGSFTLSFCRDTLTWQLKGKAEETARGPNQQEVYDLLKERGPLPTKEIAVILEREASDIKQFIHKLQDQGLVCYDRRIKANRITLDTDNHHNYDNRDNDEREEEEL